VRNGSKRVAVDLVVDATAVLRAVTTQRSPGPPGCRPRHRAQRQRRHAGLSP